MTSEITFILPTWNRRDYVVRAIESCLACQSDLLTPHVLVIDGQSDDGSFEMISEKYQHNRQVRIIQNAKGTGFQRTAYQGVSEVKTEYATFMYDDDILSPYYKDFFAQMLKHKRTFAMGYGKAFDVNQVYPFKPINTQLIDRRRLVAGYFGDVSALGFFGLPVSPIACITTAEHLRQWKDFSQAFAAQSPMRQYFMIEKNIGPDIIIYLSGILRERHSVVQAQSVVAQFSSHPESMSIQYGADPLTVGYWIGRIWAFEIICQERDRKLMAQCAGYLLVAGARILFKLLKSRQYRWAYHAVGEIWAIKLKVIRHFLVFTTIQNSMRAVSSRYKRKNAALLPL